MRDDDDDDEPLSREELNEKYLWKPGEREATEREMAERQRRIDAAETLEWARQRNAARTTTPAPEIVTRSHAMQATRSHAATMSKEWGDGLHRCTHPEGSARCG